MKRKEAKPLPLTELEAAAIEGLEALGREIQREVLAPYNAKRERINRLIEKRLKLPKGSIGKTHLVDYGSAKVIEIPKAEEERGESS